MTRWLTPRSPEALWIDSRRAGVGVGETVLVADVEEGLVAIGADLVAQRLELEDRHLVPFDSAHHFALHARELFPP